MALTIDEINSSTIPRYNKAIKDNVYDETPLLDRIRERGNVKQVISGTMARLPIRYQALNDAEAVNPHDGRVTVTQATRTAAYYEPRYYKADAAMLWDERAKNNGKQKMVSLASDKLSEAMDDLKALISDHLYQAYANIGSDEMSSLLEIIQDPTTDTTAGGVSSGDASTWIAGGYDTTTTVLSLHGTASLWSMFEDCWFKEKPDLIVSTKTIGGIYASKLQPGERRQPEGGRAGAVDLYYNGIPWLLDQDCPANHLFFLNTGSLFFFVWKDYDFSVSPWADDPDHYNAVRSLTSVVCNFGTNCRKQNGCFSAITR